MCRDRSGIILKHKIVIAPGYDNSHSNLLDDLGIEDNYINASKTFVRAELIPVNDEWWRNPEEEPEAWMFNVDQDITPDWFDRVEHEKLFREAVAEWWREHVIVDRKIENLSSGYYKLKRCEVKRLLGDVIVYLDSSQVGEMSGSSRVGTMWDSSQVGEMWGSSQVGEMRGSSQVGEMWGSSQVGEMWGSSQVGTMRGSSIARDFKDYPLVKIFVGDGKFEMLVHKNDGETKNEE